MKNFLIVTVLFASFTVAAQPVDHFNEPSARWHVAFTFSELTPEGMPFTGTTTAVWGFEGDTLIEGQTWLKTYSSPDSLFVNDLEFRGYIRSEQDIVLYRNSDLEEDTLYNFNLEVGDTWEFDDPWEVQDIILFVEEVDFAEVDGEMRKRITFSTYPATLESIITDVWIEGLGSTQKPLFPVNPNYTESAPDYRKQVACTFADDNLTWHSPFFDNCFPMVVLSAAEQVLEGISAFPNPFLSSFRVVNDRPEVLTLTVYSGQGKAVHKLQCPPGEMQVDLSAFADGIYYLLLSDGKYTTTLKMMKTR